MCFMNTSFSRALLILLSGNKFSSEIPEQLIEQSSDILVI